MALVGSGITSAAAGEDPTEAAAGLIAEVAPDQGQVVSGLEGDREVSAQTDAAVAAVPLDAEEPIRLEGTDNGGPTLEVSLPGELRLHDGEVATDGTVVFHASDGGADAAVQALADGSVRLQTITPDADATHAFSYAFGEGVRLVEGEQGTIDLVEDVPGLPGGQIVGVIDSAWAVDAAGVPVPTSYEVEGSVLRQVIRADESVTYPIVADPRIGAGLGLYLYLNKVEAGTFVGMAQSIAAVGAGAACIVYGKKVAAIPGAKLAVDKLCGYVSPAALFAFFKTLPSRLSTTYACSEVRWYLNKTTVKSVSSSLCTPISQSMQWK